MSSHLNKVLQQKPWHMYICSRHGWVHNKFLHSDRGLESTDQFLWWTTNQKLKVNHCIIENSRIHKLRNSQHASRQHAASQHTLSCIVKRITTSKFPEHSRSPRSPVFSVSMLFSCALKMSQGVSYFLNLLTLKCPKWGLSDHSPCATCDVMTICFDSHKAQFRVTLCSWM